MGVMDKFLNYMKLNEDEDDYYDDDYLEDETVEELLTLLPVLALPSVVIYKRFPIISSLSPLLLWIFRVIFRISSVDPLMYRLIRKL